MSTLVKTLERQIKDYRNLLKLPAPGRFLIRRLSPAKTVLLASPHPDDEVLMGALALRLQQENRFRVINVAVTMGSAKERQAARKKELARACRFLKWSHHILSEDWGLKEKELKRLIAKYQPALVIAPHAHDYHPAHEKTHQLVKKCIGKNHLHVAWAEYWAHQKNPNLLVEVSDMQIIHLVKALSLHAGEVARNPYHIRLLAWMMDSVRRGSEWLHKKGAHSAPMLAGQLYRIERWENGKSVRLKIPSAFMVSQDDPSDWLE